MKNEKHAQRMREPLDPVFEFELRKELENIILNNYKKDKITTRFDFKLIKMFLIYFF